MCLHTCLKLWGCVGYVVFLLLFFLLLASTPSQRSPERPVSCLLKPIIGFGNIYIALKSVRSQQHSPGSKGGKDN